MKQNIQEISEENILKNYPSKSKIDGWYFRINEISVNVYEIEAEDKWGRIVSLQCTDPENLIVQCETEISKIKNKSNSK